MVRPGQKTIFKILKKDHGFRWIAVDAKSGEIVMRGETNHTRLLDALNDAWNSGNVPKDHGVLELVDEENETDVK